MSKAFNWFVEDNETPWRLIYKLSGDELTVCGASENTELNRPSEFVSTKKEQNDLLTFKRVKAETK